MADVRLRRVLNHLEHRIPWPSSSECVTRGVKVVVTITNESEHTLQLLTRHWIITDATGKTMQVGPKAYGVVGQQPMLRPGESFSYGSLCPLATELGTMHGSFEMLILEPAELNGERFEADIGRFGLTLTGEDALMPIVID